MCEKNIFKKQYVLLTIISMNDLYSFVQEHTNILTR